ncbi:MAG: bacillithiol transferase BstA [Acidobacteriota bacterium]|nr:bacillithiol transferase BstA [Acidobacteriota bacterium]
MDLQYPIGKFAWTHSGDGLVASEADRQEWLADIEDMPSRLWAAVTGLTEPQLDTPYRPGGWTVRQVVHHLADSHLNSYVRFRLALTEDEPTIKPYDQKLWAQLSDAQTAPADLSLTLVEALHQRWVLLLRSLKPEDFARTVKHPELGKVTLEKYLALYAWHGKHHVAHITALRQRSGWKPASA